MHSSSEISFNFHVHSLSTSIMMSIPSLRKFSSIAYSVRKRSINHGDTVVRVPANGRIQSFKINTLLNNMFDHIIRTVKTVTNRFSATTGQLNFQLWQSTQGCYELQECVAAGRSQTQSSEVSVCTFTNVIHGYLSSTLYQD